MIVDDRIIGFYTKKSGLLLGRFCFRKAREGWREGRTEITARGREGWTRKGRLRRKEGGREGRKEGGREGGRETRTDGGENGGVWLAGWQGRAGVDRPSRMVGLVEASVMLREERVGEYGWQVGRAGLE